LEAAAYGKPMVSTTIGAEGLAFRDGHEILIRDDDAGFAEACLALFDDDALAARLGCAARGVVAETYDIDVIARQVFAGQVFT
jgi:glycosyltransferase involved in cell wall biosynthesis